MYLSYIDENKIKYEWRIKINKKIELEYRI